MTLKTIQDAFAACQTPEAIYAQIMAFGKSLPPFDPSWKIEENRVSGCQSEMYLHVIEKGGRLYFYAASDALISAGLAALLIQAFNGVTPEEMLKSSPAFLETLGIPAALSPTRAGGLASLYLTMKKRALRILQERQ